MIQRWRIGIPFALLADLREPITRLTTVQHGEDRGRIQE
jgi:hypothetical protein